MKNTFPVSLGLAVGSFAGLIHIVWSLMVATGLALPWVRFVTSMHFIDISVSVRPFDLGSAVMLVVLASIIGFILGYIFGTVWKKVNA